VPNPKCLPEEQVPAGDLRIKVRLNLKIPVQQRLFIGLSINASRQSNRKIFKTTPTELSSEFRGEDLRY
jgi:hypothetical protein